MYIRWTRRVKSPRKTALSKFRNKKTRYDVIMYVYVTAEKGTLKGVVDYEN
jgi:Mg/Co/Ni transporter MgtE